MKKCLGGIVLAVGSACFGQVAHSDPYTVRNIVLIPCAPFATIDGTRVIESFAPNTAACSRSEGNVWIRIAEYAGVNALCSYRGGGRSCTPLTFMNQEERAHFERLRAYAQPAPTYGVCTVGDGKTWRTDMVTPHKDCSYEIHAMRHWDFVQGRVYLKDGLKGIGSVDIEDIDPRE